MINKASCAQFVQLRTEYCELNKYLHRFEKRDNSTCEYKYEVKTVKHFFFKIIIIIYILI